MEPNKTITDKNNSNHKIEWGKSTWNNKSVSIRNRYDLDSGKFNKAGSSEIPWEDFKMMISESISNDILNNKEIAEILKQIADKLSK